MNEEDVEKVALFVFTAVIVALVNRHGWTEADARELIQQIKVSEMPQVVAMFTEELARRQSSPGGERAELDAGGGEG